jgi:uncharacterized metal-binding protein YceD (DUF177 family)
MTKPIPPVQYEFSRPLEAARVSKLGSHEKLLATETECGALAKRLQVPKIHSLKADLKAQAWRGGGMKVAGQAMIDLDQESVVSLEIFRSTQLVPVERFFLNIKGDADVDTELEIDPIEHGIIDLGELVAESVALELDPYPRMPGESFTAIIESDPSNDEKPPSPFTVLQFPKGKS